MYLWTGEIADELQGYHVIGTGEKGTFQIPANMAQHYPAVLPRPPVRNERQRQSLLAGPHLPAHAVNPLILALDTTHEFGSIALLEGRKVVEEVLLHSPDGFGHVLFGHLERLLDRNGRRVDEIACFAAAAGPGSFTGVRVGLACIKGLAEATGARW